MKNKRQEQPLPDWFDLAKYKPLKCATDLDWYTQLVIRRECWDFAHQYDPALEEQDDQLPSMPRGDGAVQKLIALMRRDGVVKLEDIRRVCKSYPWGDHILGEIDRLKPSVHPLTIEELYRARTGIEEERRKRFDQLFIAELTPEGRAPYMEYLGLINTYHDQAYENSGIGDGVHTYQKVGLTETGLSTFWVNLRLPDSLLIQQFKICLRNSRKIADLKIRKTVRRQNTKQWARYRVLPYIDLALWMRQTGTRMPRPAVADALFPLGRKDEETVRRTIRPLAMSLLHRHSISFLQLKHQASQCMNKPD